MDEISRKINILLNVEKKFIAKAEYVFRTFCKMIGSQPAFYYDYSLEDIHVYYGGATEEKYPVKIYHDLSTADFFENYSLLDKDEVHFVQYRDENIPFLFSQKGILLHQAHNRLIVRKDIIASAFFFLSCWEEYVYTIRKDKANSKDAEKNKKKKVEFKNQYLAKEWDFFLTPVVDRYCGIFQKSLELALPGYQKLNRWFEDKEFAVAVIHLLSSISPQNLKEYKQINDLKKIIKYEEKKEVQTTNFFPIPDSKKRSIMESLIEAYLKPDYNISRKEYISFQNDQVETSIGIYTNKRCSSQEIYLASEIFKEHNLLVNGHTFLNLDEHYSKLFNELESTKIKYDMSIFYDNLIGYRAGISFPFYPYNIQENKPYTVLEIPPAICFGNLNKGLDDPLPLKNYVNYHLQKTDQRESLMTIMLDNKMRGKFSLYKKILSYVVRNNGLITSPDYISDKWLT